MKGSKDNKAKRKEFKNQFYKHNKLLFTLAIFATILIALLNLIISWEMQQIIDISTGMSTELSLLQITLIVAFSVVVFIFVMILQFQTLPRFIKKAMKQYKDYAFEEITKKSISSFTGENTSTYISALTNDATSIETNYLSKIFTLVMQIIMFIGAFILMLFYSPYLTLIAFLLSLVPVIASMLTGNRLAAAEKNVSDQNESFLGMVKDTLSGFSVIKSFKAEREIIKQFSKNNQKTEELKCKRRMTDLLIQTIGLIAGVIAQFGVFLFGAYLTVSGKGVTAGVVIVFVQLMNYVLSPISDVPQILANRKAANALIDKLIDAIYSNVQREGKQVDNKLDDAIEVRNLSYAYEKDSPILKDISMRFEAGKSYALVGGSGSGKSTLLNLLMGSYENYKGEILYDGEELRTISSDSLYDLVSIIQQNVFIFNSSIRDNITMFREFEAKKVDRAILMSGLSNLIKERGHDYSCGENGCGLSGGERQRISIARSLLHETPVLFVDEATAALDTATAFSVTNSILDISGLTRIIVTHRLEEALLKKYDQILVLRNGKVDEVGTFEELMEKREYFYSLYTVAQ